MRNLILLVAFGAASLAFGCDKDDGGDSAPVAGAAGAETGGSGGGGTGGRTGGSGGGAVAGSAGEGASQAGGAGQAGSAGEGSGQAGGGGQAGSAGESASQAGGAGQAGSAGEGSGQAGASGAGAGGAGPNLDETCADYCGVVEQVETCAPGSHDECMTNCLARVGGDICAAEFEQEARCGGTAPVGDFACAEDPMAIEPVMTQGGACADEACAGYCCFIAYFGDPAFGLTDYSWCTCG